MFITFFICLFTMYAPDNIGIPCAIICVALGLIHIIVLFQTDEPDVRASIRMPKQFYIW